jgi:hypothetical protein
MPGNSVKVLENYLAAVIDGEYHDLKRRNRALPEIARAANSKDDSDDWSHAVSVTALERPDNKGGMGETIVARETKGFPDVPIVRFPYRVEGGVVSAIPQNCSDTQLFHC